MVFSVSPVELALAGVVLVTALVLLIRGSKKNPVLGVVAALLAVLVAVLLFLAFGGLLMR